MTTPGPLPYRYREETGNLANRMISGIRACWDATGCGTRSMLPRIGSTMSVPPTWCRRSTSRSAPPGSDGLPPSWGCSRPARSPRVAKIPAESSSTAGGSRTERRCTALRTQSGTRPSVRCHRSGGTTHRATRPLESWTSAAESGLGGDPAAPNQRSGWHPGSVPVLYARQLCSLTAPSTAASCPPGRHEALRGRPRWHTRA